MPFFDKARDGSLRVLEELQGRKSLRLCLALLGIRLFDSIAEASELPDHLPSAASPGVRHRGNPSCVPVVRDWIAPAPNATFQTSASRLLASRISASNTDHSTFWRPTLCLKMPGTSFRKKRFKAWRISRSIPRPAGRIMRSIARHGTCSIPILSEATSTASKRAPRNFRQTGRMRMVEVDDRRFLPIFLSPPQGSLIVHSFCTSAKCFSVAAPDDLPQSGFTENVGPPKARRTMIAANWRQTGNSRG